MSSTDLTSVVQFLDTTTTLHLLSDATFDTDHISSSRFWYKPVRTGTYLCTAVPWVPRFIPHHANYRVVQNTPSTVQTGIDRYGFRCGRYAPAILGSMPICIGRKNYWLWQSKVLFFGCCLITVNYKLFFGKFSDRWYYGFNIYLKPIETD
jgi:hypothetical protein